MKNRKKIIVIVLLAAACVLAVSAITAVRFFTNNQNVRRANPKGRIEMYSDKNYLYYSEGFADIKIVDEDSASKAVFDIECAALGRMSLENDLKLEGSEEVDGKTIYRARQYYKGVPVFGRGASLLVDKDGNVLSMTTNAENFRLPGFSSEPIPFDSEKAEERLLREIKNSAEFSDKAEIKKIGGAKRCVYSFPGADRTYAYRFDVIVADGGAEYDRAAIVSEKSCDVLYFAPAAEKYRNADGERFMSESINEVLERIYELHAHGQASDDSADATGTGEAADMSSYSYEEGSEIKNAAILERCVSLMYNGINGNDAKRLDPAMFAGITDKALRLMQFDATFEQFAQAFYASARNTDGMTSEQKACVAEAFETVGLSGSGLAEMVAYEAPLIVNGKDGKPVRDCHIEIGDLSTEKTIVKEDIGGADGYQLSLNSGHYEILVSDNTKNSGTVVSKRIYMSPSLEYIKKPSVVIGTDF